MIIKENVKNAYQVAQSVLIQLFAKNVHKENFVVYHVHKEPYMIIYKENVLKNVRKTQLCLHSQSPDSTLHTANSVMMIVQNAQFKTVKQNV